MTWRDNPEIIWQDDDGDALGVGASTVWASHRSGAVRGVASVPESLDDRVEATERWLAAMGLEADNTRELPRPIEIGDTVRFKDGLTTYVVHAIDDDAALLRDSSDNPAGAWLAELVPIDSDDNPEWVITRYPQEIAAALDDLAVDRDRYREAFSQLVNEIGEHVTWLRDWETDPDMSPHRAAAELESAIDDIEREQGIDE